MVILSRDLASNLSIVWNTAKLVHRGGELINNWKDSL